MALLLQCLRDVRTKAGDPDMIPPMNDCGSRDGHHAVDGDETRDDLPARATNASPFAKRSQRELEEACH